MRKRAVALALAFALLWLSVFVMDTFSTRVHAQDDWLTKAKGAALLDAGSGRLLFAQNAHTRLPMASTTKIMTALLTLEQEDLDTVFLVDSAAIHVEGSSMGLCEGDRVTLGALAVGMLLPSGNDAANAAAVRISGSQQAFVVLMNERAAELGMVNTHFVTPSGLDASDHYSTAYDMAILAREALQNPRFAEICRQSKGTVEFGNPPYQRWLTNHNRLLKNNIGAIGVKTGFTDAAGRCLVSAVERDGVRLIAVTLSCPDDWNEHTKLYDHYYNQLRTEDTAAMIPRISVPVTGGAGEWAQTAFDPPAPVVLLPGEQLEMTVTAQPFVYAPVKKGQVLGSVRFSAAGEPLGETTLVAANDIPARKKERTGWLSRLLS